MIFPEKTITDNPFVDNILYYSKLIALNCTIKDEQEALSQETPESLRRRELLISSIEKTSTYEVYESIPEEILEKYVTPVSNIDIYANSLGSLQTYMNSYKVNERNDILSRLSNLAANIYASHYDIMMNHLSEIGDTWIDDNKELFDNCVNGTANYNNLFKVIPFKTRCNIIGTYINNYDNTNIEDIANDLYSFEVYINNRSDSYINGELNKISKAMRDVFIGHYTIMKDRGYLENAVSDWIHFFDDENAYKKAMNGTATYMDMYMLFPNYAIIESLLAVFDEDTIQNNGLDRDPELLDNYIKNIDPNGAVNAYKLNKVMSDRYLENYNIYLNSILYSKCLNGTTDFYELYDHLPLETRKIILSSVFEEKTNLQEYADSKKLFNAYLNTLNREERNRIKTAITVDMQNYYPSHHEELNNYYRTLIGLPPLDDNGKVMEDTLKSTYDAEHDQNISLTHKKFIDRLPEGVYPESHWNQEIYKFDAYDIGILNQYGILEDWLVACGSDLNNPRYKYLRYLGDEKLDLYTCSKAMNFQLIGIPTIDDSEFKRKFTDTYVVNRDYIIRAVYSEAHKFQSDYYDKFIIIFILMNTIMDCLTGITDHIINREVFDSRCIKYLFESYGIPFYSEIPIKYQKAMLKNLNTLIKFKSSTRNMVDICSLFGFSDVRVFGYYLFKQRLIDDSTGEYNLKDNIYYDISQLYVRHVNGDEVDYNGVRYYNLPKYLKLYPVDENKYTKTISVESEKDPVRILNNDSIKNVYIREKSEDDKGNDIYEFIPFKDSSYFTQINANTAPAELKFIKVPIDENLSAYKNDPDYIVPYDEVVYQDEGNTWHGGEDYNVLYNKLLDHEFNAVKTKYISVETVTDMTELSFQVSYFYNMLFDNMYSEDNLTVEIPHIKIGHKFRFMDVVCYLFSLMYLYNGLEDNIMYSPTQMLYIKGYDFNNDTNTVLKNIFNYAQKNPVTDEDIENYKREFNINERISEDGYDYRKAFEHCNMKAFNLECDVDRLETWLNNNFQMSLDDFVVQDNPDPMQDITLRSFFSLNNSYYQKSLFTSDNLYPVQSNQNIKYAFGYELLKKTPIEDINDNKHEYLDNNTEVITDSSDTIYIMDHTKYISNNKGDYAIYYKYNRQDDAFEKFNNTIYHTNKVSGGLYNRLFNGKIAIADKNDNYIFAADAYFIKKDKIYDEIIDEEYFREDNNKLSDYDKIFKFGEYYIYKDGKWVLDDENCYVKITQGTDVIYDLLKNADNYENILVLDDDSYVKDIDGHFIRLSETDFYKKKESGEDYNGYVYTEEDCYIKSANNKKTEFFDPTVKPRVYYEKLSDYYNRTNYIISDTYYILNSNGEYVAQSNLIDPNNCYYKDENNEYHLVIESLSTVKEYDADKYKTISSLFILQSDNDYVEYTKDGDIYLKKFDINKRYVYNSDFEYITVLNKNDTYDSNNIMVVIFNKELTSYKEDNIINTSYDPEKSDGVWDENDWYYSDDYLGEHSWYYKNPNGTTVEPEEEEEKDAVGSGFYIKASSYLDENIKLIEGNKYYLSLDIKTNFTGTIQIACVADNTVCDGKGLFINSQARIYSVKKDEEQHIDQIFIANDIEQPRLVFLIYDYEDNPINFGDLIEIGNIRFVESYNNNYIAQDIPSYDRLQELYRTNESIYKYLITLMANTDDLRTYNIYKHIYDSMMTAKYNKEAFKLEEGRYAKTYTDFLETRDAVLYEKLCYFKSLDPDALRKQVADNIVEVSYAIDDCIDTYSYGYLYSYFPAVSASYIQQYIIKIINFFKSWKVHLLGINTVYKFDDKLENTIKILERHQERIRIDDAKGNVFIYGGVKINPMDSITMNENGEKVSYSELFPDFVEHSHKLNDHYTIHDRVRIISSTANGFDHFYDSDNELMLRLNNIETKVSIDENNNLVINSDKYSISVEDKNKAILTTDESDHEVFGIQRIGEINSNTIDLTN